MREDSGAVDESFWDASGVEIGAGQDLGFWAVTCGHSKPYWPIFGPLGLSWPVLGAFWVIFWDVFAYILGRFELYFGTFWVIF